eukprot:gene4389-14515_t
MSRLATLLVDLSDMARERVDPPVVEGFEYLHSALIELRKRRRGAIEAEISRLECVLDGWIEALGVVERKAEAAAEGGYGENWDDEVVEGAAGYEEEEEEEEEEKAELCQSGEEYEEEGEGAAGRSAAIEAEISRLESMLDGWIEALGVVEKKAEAAEGAYGDYWDGEVVEGAAGYVEEEEGAAGYDDEEEEEEEEAEF